MFLFHVRLLHTHSFHFSSLLGTSTHTNPTHPHPCVPLPLRTPTGSFSHGMVTRGIQPTARPTGDDSRPAINIPSTSPSSLSRLALPRLALPYLASPCPTPSRPALPHLASRRLECLCCDHDKCVVVVCCVYRHRYPETVYITSSCFSFALALVVCVIFAPVLWVLQGPAEFGMFMLCGLALPTPVADFTGACWRRKQFRPG